MLKLIPISSGRILNLTMNSLSEKKDRTKSTFIDSNRIDTVKIHPGDLTKEGFIESGYFYKMIFDTCYKASISDNKIVSLSCDGSKSIKSYLENFFENNNLGAIVNNRDYDYHYSIEIKVKLNENITFEDIGNAYISELEKINLSDEDIKGKKLILKKKINNEEN